jgi:hypothetical protein
LRPNSQRIQTHSLRPYIWVKEQGSGLCLVAKQTLISESSPLHDHEREFLVEVRASDDTIAIYEAKASGGFGGCVFARARVPLSNPRGQHIRVSDIYSGASLQVAGRTFDVLEADAFTMKFVRANPLLFPQRALASVLRSIVDAQQLELLAYDFCQCDLAACGHVPTGTFLRITGTVAASATVLQDRIALAQEYVIETAESCPELKISYSSFLTALRAVAAGQSTPPTRPPPPPAAPPPDSASSAAAAADLQSHLRNKLLARGLNSGRIFLSALAEACLASHGALDRGCLQHALHAVGVVDLSPPQLQILMRSFSEARPTIHDVLSSVHTCFTSNQRAATCSRLFTSLDKLGSGSITSNDLVGRFDSVAACQLLRGSASCTELRAQWIAVFEGRAAQDAISSTMFLSGMSQLSWLFVEDDLFNSFATRCLGAKIYALPNRP